VVTGIQREHAAEVLVWRIAVSEVDNSIDAPSPEVAGAMLVRALKKARWITFWERLWPPLAAVATAVGLFLAVMGRRLAVAAADCEATETERTQGTATKSVNPYRRGSAADRSGASAVHGNGDRHMNRASLLFCILGITFVTIGDARAQRNELPAGPNRDLVFRECQACHDLSMVFAATGLNRDGWDATIEEMVSYGMRTNPEDRAKILEYLSSFLGTPSAPNAPESR
jgi:hypothetical protein